MDGTAKTVAVVVMLVALAAVACSPPKGESSQAVRTVFTVSGMHCDSCNAAIADALQGTAGVIEASADYMTGEAVAVHRLHEVSAEELKAAIEKLGYTVTAMTTTPVETTSLEPLPVPASVPVSVPVPA